MFFNIQAIGSYDLEKAIHGVLRHESQFDQIRDLARGLSDLEELGLIRCVNAFHARLENAVYDSTYKGNCETSWIRLDGIGRKVDVRSLNGDIWRINFVTNNPSAFFGAVWTVRIAGILVIFLAWWAFRAQFRRREEATAIKMESAQRLRSIARQLAHDIRSPLTAIQTALAANGDLTSERKDLIRSAAQRVESIAQDLLRRNWSEGERGGCERRSTHGCTVNEVIATIESLLGEKKSAVENKRLAMTFSSETNVDPEALYSCEAGKLSRVISNLINNSIDAVGDDGKITLKMSANIAELRIDIVDDGCGISKPDLARLLSGEAFSTKLSKSDSGWGLGLSGARAYIQDECGGVLSVHSKLGLGTAISITLRRTTQSTCAL
ncbi:MAG: HAMP domain-containing histidine kinase [Calothrix sp. SM1_5_4]|nr:HAMP domain-containing histidine kinase [Calothrix sp. SM1_5_4]